MKLIVLLPNLEAQLQPLTQTRPHALLPLAGGTVLGHVLNFVAETFDPAADTAVFVADESAARVQTWLDDYFPGLQPQLIMHAPAGTGTAGLLWQTHSVLDHEPALIHFGDCIIETEFEQLPEAGADVVVLVKEPVPGHRATAVQANADGQVTGAAQGAESTWVAAGGLWLRHGAELRDALEALLDQHAGAGLAELLQALLARGLTLKIKPVSLGLETNSIAALLEANARLLGLGYGATQDAIERSYAEDFTVLPPVFIDETAVLDNVVIGPFVHIGAGATVRNSIVRSTIIDAGTHVEDMALVGSLLGQEARAVGRPFTLRLGDRSTLSMTEPDV